MQTRILTLLFALVLVGLSSCTKDTCEQEVTYLKYTPIELSYAEIRATIQTEAPRDMITPGKLYFYQDYIFINENKTGIHIINNADPANPIPEYFLPIPMNQDLVIRGDLLYADNATDLVVLNISNLNQVQLVKRQEDVFPSQGQAENGNLIVGYDTDMVTENLDCNAPRGDIWFGDAFLSNAEFSSTAPASVVGASDSRGTQGVGGSFARFTLYQDYLYMVQNWQLRVFDLSRPDCPEEKESINLNRNVETIYPYGDKLFIGSTTGMEIYDLTNPAIPTYVSGYNHWTGCDPVIVHNDLAYVTIHAGFTCTGNLNQLDVLDVSDIFNPVLKKSFQMEQPKGLSIIDEALFLCEGDAGLKIFDINDPLTLNDRLLHTVRDINAYDVIGLPGQQDILLLIGETGFYQYDVSDPANPVELSKIQVLKN